MAYSELDLFNAALAELGEETQISDIDTLTPGRQLRVCRSLIAGVRDPMLQKHPWLCCLRRRLLAKINVAPGGDWLFPSAFALPLHVRRVWVVDTDMQWERGHAEEVGADGFPLGTRDVILTYGQGPIRVVTIEWAGYENLTPLLFNAMAISLASRIAGPLQADKAMKKDLKADADRAMADAVMAETSEFGNEEGPFFSRWIEARWGGSGEPWLDPAPVPFTHGHV